MNGFRRAAVILTSLAMGCGATAAYANQNPAAAKTPCFYQSKWDGWSAPDNNTVYARMRGGEVYRITLTRNVPQLLEPGAQVVSVRDRDHVCHPLDLDLRVSDFGVILPLRAASITKMTAEEIAAIPRDKHPWSRPDIRR